MSVSWWNSPPPHCDVVTFRSIRCSRDEGGTSGRLGDLLWASSHADAVRERLGLGLRLAGAAALMVSRMMPKMP